MRSKLRAILKANAFATIGATLRDRAKLFLIGCLNQIDHPQKRTRWVFSRLLQVINGWQELIRITVCIHGRCCQVTLRTGDLGDYQSAYECLGSMYQPPEVPVRYLLDAGGNIGLFSLVASVRFPCISEIVIVEPDAENLHILRLNIEGMSGAQVVACALAKDLGVSKFHRKASNMGHLMADSAGEDGVSSYTVETRRLTDVLPTHWLQEYLWLKLDIEGAEYAVFDEMLAAGQRPAVISAELHDITRNGGDQMIERLRKAGYEIVVQGSGRQDVVDRQIYAAYTQKRD